MGCAVVVGGPDWMADTGARGLLRQRLREVAPDALRSVRGTVPHREVEISTGALREVVARVNAAKRSAEFPVLCAAEYAGVLFVPGLERSERKFPIELGPSAGGIRKLFPLEDLVRESQAALPLVGLSAPLPQQALKNVFKPGEFEEMMQAGLVEATNLGDAKILLSAVSTWGPEAFERGSCMWFVK